jgi:hypothetical protein
MMCFLKYHDPSIFEFAPKQSKDIYLRPDSNRRVLRRGVYKPLSADDSRNLKELYAKGGLLQGLTNVLGATAVWESGCLTAQCLDTPKRCFRTISSIKKCNPWEYADSVVEYVDEGEPAYAIITVIFKHRPFLSPCCPIIDVFKVQTLTHEPGVYEPGRFLDRVELPANVSQSSGDAFIFCSAVTDATCVIMPSVPSDEKDGYAYNILQIP